MNKSPTLQILENIDVKTPCHESWDAMAGSEAKRHCKKCEHSVINLSAFTEEEAARLLSSRGTDRLCVRYTVHADGGVSFKPRLSSVGMIQRAISYASVVLMTFLGFSSVTIAEQAPENQQSANTHPEQYKLGEMAQAPTSTPIPQPPRREVMGNLVAPTVTKMGKVAAQPKEADSSNTNNR